VLDGIAQKVKQVTGNAKVYPMVKREPKKKK
jgi:hypothetical protein